ncbi:hypothetical protein RN001_014407 [Aquatica leii]|uniref:Uncharacterized protein n=1 Tax=Aquatica leii TaxID=1421715 RepID=A0AAN7P0J7_9COLE|nr:hypothetical protein RN001_014407 [Aquatica leii]
MQELQKQSSDIDNDHLIGLYFDGRRDKTLSRERANDKYYQRTIVEDHYSLVKEPGSRYIGHVTPASGSTLAIAESFSHILVLGCDGTAVNTGVHKEVLRCLELKTGKGV